ncbi:uncharacterized protein RJT20DRAFT_130540 [Scheffersomyces xylosifermentans]|uniref:uncharacterized protein n=1 Tax=Scheffersomyces xylosifermentans TaxID=1304137 RepID=UPI00315DF01C
MPLPNLPKLLRFLINESKVQTAQRYTIEWLEAADADVQYHLLEMLLCQRTPELPLPEQIRQEIYQILTVKRDSKLLTSRHSIEEKFEFVGSPNKVKISIWKGDITTITDVTAIVNAANPALLGCFEPDHGCIDNVIHATAGPDLRQACYDIMIEQIHEEPVGNAKITPGFNLPAKNVIHTVGPQLKRGEEPSEAQAEQLASCYTSSLSILENIEEDGNDKSIVFCCISTGLFSFPSGHACAIAIESVRRYFEEKQDSSISEVVFNVFTEQDYILYTKMFGKLQLNNVIKRADHPIYPTYQKGVEIAKNWLSKADNLIISAGAGLSSSVGLDYLSPELFDKYYSNFKKYGPTTLYSTIGHQWPSEIIEWSFWFHHYYTISRWQESETYQKLIQLANSMNNSFVITTNADGFFVKNGYDTKKVFTVQGSYYWIQCPRKCSDFSYKEMEPVFQAVKPYIDASTGLLKGDCYVPRCDNCGATMTMCLRGGWNFNDHAFTEQKIAYKEFINNVTEQNSTAVILEFGVGLNTPSILRWPNEEIVTQLPDNFKLVRVGLGPSSTIPLDILGTGNAIILDADASVVIDLIVKS